MENLRKLYPIVAIIYGEGGISSSEAQRLKEDLKNESVKLAEPLIYTPEKMYITKREIISGSGVARSFSELSEIITPEDFNVLPQIAVNNSKSAIYGFAIRFKEEINRQIIAMGTEEIGQLLDVRKPEFTLSGPTRRSAVRINIDTFCQKERIEDLFESASQELLQRIGDFYHKAMQIESSAAVYGIQVANQNSFLRKLMSSPEALPKKERLSSTFLVDETQVLALKKEDFSDVEKRTMGIYTNAQKERNMYMKLIKDHARALQREYDERYANEYNHFVNAHELYNNELYSWQAECEKLRTVLLSEVAALKILV